MAETAIQRIIQKIGLGEVMALKEILEDLRPAEGETFEGEKPVPIPAVLSPAAIEAAKRLPDVFGQVCPEAARALTPDEVAALAEERGVLKVLEKTIKDRIEDIRTIAFNAMDSQRTAEFDAEVLKDVPLDKDGHFIARDQIAIPDTDQCFRREPGQKAAVLSGSALEALIDDPTIEFTRDDYNAMTTQTRVVDEAKIMLHLRKNPKVLEAISRATVPGSKYASLNIRKQ